MTARPITDVSPKLTAYFAAIRAELVDRIAAAIRDEAALPGNTHAQAEAFEKAAWIAATILNRAEVSA